MAYDWDSQAGDFVSNVQGRSGMGVSPELQSVLDKIISKSSTVSGGRGLDALADVGKIMAGVQTTGMGIAGGLKRTGMEGEFGLAGHEIAIKPQMMAEQRRSLMSTTDPYGMGSDTPPSTGAPQRRKIPWSPALKSSIWD